jgi:transcriptional regulator NrdR family protein
MICPKCHRPHSKIVDSRPDPEKAETTRLHCCRVCAHDWITLELERRRLIPHVLPPTSRVTS